MGPYSAGGLESFQPKDARGVEKTTGKVDINELTSEDENDQNKGRKVVSKPRQKSAGKGRNSRRKSSGSSRSSSSRSSSSDSDRSGRRNPQSKVAEKPKKQKNASPVVLKSTPDAARGDKAGNSRQDRSKGGNDNMDKEPVVQEAIVEETEVKNQMDVVTEDREKEEEAEREDKQDKKERRHSSSSSSSSSSKTSKGGGSTKDYSDSEREEEKGKKEKKEEATATPVVALDDDKEEAGEREEETVAVVGEGDGEAEEVRRDVPAAVVEVAVNREDDEEEKQQKKFDDAAKEPTIVAAPPVELSTTAEAADHGGDKRRNSDASTSSVSTSSSSGSASIADKGPNTKNDPTAVASHPQEVEIQRNREEREEARIAAQVKTPLMEVEVKSEDAPQKEDKTVKEAESEDSSSDSSNSDSDNEDEAQKKKDELALEKKRQEEEEENLRIKKLKEEQEREKLQELEREKERQRKLEEEERERQRPKEEEEKKQAESVPAVKVSRHSGSSSDSDSSDSDDDNRDKKTTSSKNGVIQTEADVHRRQSGHDPDNVANGPEDAPPSPPRPPAATVPKAQTGSIQPLLEKSKSMVEIKGVTLNKSQLYECAAHVENNGRISQLNLVNCGLDDDDIQKVVEAVKASPSNPVLLNLSLNPITPRCADYLLDLLDAKSSIEALLLQGTRLGDEGATILADGLLSSHKRKKEQKGRGESLKELRELDLSDSKIGDDGLKAVARLVSSDMEVDTLTLSSNEAVSESGWTHLADAIARNHTLETLTLDHNLLGDSGVKIIADGLKYNTTVTALDLNGVGIGQEGGRALVELLKVNTTLLEITLVGNSRLDKSMLDDINKYIALNKTMGSSQSQS